MVELRNYLRCKTERNLYSWHIWFPTVFFFFFLSWWRKIIAWLCKSEQCSWGVKAISMAKGGTISCPIDLKRHTLTPRGQRHSSAGGRLDINDQQFPELHACCFIGSPNIQLIVSFHSSGSHFPHKGALLLEKSALSSDSSRWRGFLLREKEEESCQQWEPQPQ